MNEQKEASVFFTRWSVFVATLASTTLAAWWSIRLMSDEGVNSVESLLIALQTLLIALIAFSLWLAMEGFFTLLSRGAAAERPAVDAATGKTAILVPVYNESPADVFARIDAMRASLEEGQTPEQFDFFVLSDTNKPALAQQEEAQWKRSREEASQYPVFYRRREQNIGRKAGNIQEFCTRWGGRYDYLVVLDADSLMSGQTLVTMVRRIEADPSLGLLQTVPIPANQSTLWGRCQQFAAQAYGPIFSEGLSRFAGMSGNYWGHNAIVRREAFTRHCGLDRLPGHEPLGGEILSHDFVEAALLRRAGYGVRLDCDLGGSYEECPASLPAFAGRDRRWCQGNLQHLQIALTGNVHSMSRLYLLLGAMSYVSSPLWLLSILVGLIAAATGVLTTDASATHWFALFAGVMTMLLLPRVLAITAVMARGHASRFGGPLRLVVSAVLETVLSVLVAPVMMLYHSRFVVTTLLGNVVQWNAQPRDEHRLAWSESWRAHAWQTGFAVLLVLAVALVSPMALPWISPVVVGLLLAAPLSVLLANARVGEWLRSAGLLLTPSESDTPEELAHFARLRQVRQA